MKNLACSKMWTDINLNIPTKEIKNCCKRQSAKLTVDELKFLGNDSFTKHKLLVDDKNFMIKNNQLPDACHGCKITWPNSLWKNWNEWKDRDWSQEQLTDLPNKDYVNQIEIMLGITCNQTCMYCTEFVSSLWADVKGIPIINDNEWENTALTNLFNYIETEKYNDNKPLYYNFLGGEPLLEPRIFEVIEKIIMIHRLKNVSDKTIIINMTTNLNVKPKTIDRYIEIIEKNTDIIWSISASIDAIGFQGEEIRDGLIFERFEQNLNKIYVSKKFKHINILPSVSALSVPNKVELLKWFIDISTKYKNVNEFGDSWSIGTNIVTWPDAMHPGILPDTYKSELDLCIEVIKNLKNTNQSFVNNYIKHLENIQSLIGSKRQVEYLEAARNWYLEQGKIKNKDYFEIFPFLKEIL
jgi:hypothetical protein